MANNKAKRIAFVMDPIEKIKPEKDSSFAMMLALQAADCRIFYIAPETICLKQQRVYCVAQELQVEDNNTAWFTVIEQQTVLLAEFDRVFMRVDPPFDMNYIYLTYLLELAEQESITHNQSTVFINKPSSIRACNEKLFTAWFPHCCPETVVTKRYTELKQFLAQQQRIIIKPLDGMGGQSIFYLQQGDPNTNVILETITAQQTQFVMAQRYLPEAKQGDKRITLFNGEPVSHAVLRVPAKDELRANLAQGGSAEIIPLTERDRWLCAQVGPELKARGLYWVGLDVIGDYITEINVTSPTCLRELEGHVYTNFEHGLKLLLSF